MVATKPVDFRKGVEGLAALVREAMGADPFAPKVLRACHARPRADRQRGADAHRRALSHRGRDPRGRPAEQRRQVRRELSRPLVEALEPWLRHKLQLISQKTKLAEAIRYALSRWPGLCLFLDDGRGSADGPRRCGELLPWAYHATAELKAVA
jgi:hypothetical protein